MAARFKITKVWGPRDDDREKVVGHIGFVWKPDPEFDSINTTRLVKDEQGNWSRRNGGEIQGATLVRIYDAAVMEYEDKKTHQIGYFLSIDGINIPREVTDEVMAQARPLLVEATKTRSLQAAAGHAPDDDDAAAASDIPF